MTKKKVLEVQTVKLSVLESLPRKLVILASGTVPTRGWKDAELIPHTYIQPPPDGIYGYDFVAEPPDQPVPEIITPIETYTVDPLPDDLKGVKVHASLNSKVALLGESVGRVIVVKGVLTDEGAECQALRTDAGELYTLIGDLKGFQVGDRVCVAGMIADSNICQQGRTIVVMWIGKHPLKG